MGLFRLGFACGSSLLAFGRRERNPSPRCATCLLAPSPSSSPTSRVRRSCCMSSAPRSTRGRWRSIAASCVRRSRPIRASRSIRRAMPSSSPSRLRPALSEAAAEALEGLAGGTDSGAHGHPHGNAASWRGGLRRSRRAPGGPHRRLRPRRAGAGLSLHRCACGHGRAARPGRAPAEGPVRARAHLPARGRRLPAAQEPAPNEPAHPRHALPGPRAGTGRGARAGVASRRPPADADRPRRHG